MAKKATKRKPNAAFMKPVQPDAALSEIVGSKPLPRKPLNNSVIASEQAYRKRKGLPLLTEEDMEALRQGVPMSWEAGGSGIAAAPAAATAAPPAPQAAAPAAPAAPSTPMSNTAGGLSPLPRKALNNSVISAEQAYRKRKGMPQLNEAEIYCLKQGLPMPWEPGGVMPDPVFAKGLNNPRYRGSETAPGDRWSSGGPAEEPRIRQLKRS